MPTPTWRWRAFHAEVIDKVGALIGRMTYGVRAETAIELFQHGLELHPNSPGALMEYARGLLMLEGEARTAEATASMNGPRHRTGRRARTARRRTGTRRAIGLDLYELPSGLTCRCIFDCTPLEDFVLNRMPAMAPASQRLASLRYVIGVKAHIFGQHSPEGSRLLVGQRHEHFISLQAFSKMLANAWRSPSAAVDCDQNFASSPRIWLIQAERLHGERSLRFAD